MAVAASIPIALSTTPAMASASCGTTVAGEDGSAWSKTADSANEHSGSGTSCAISGIAYNTQRLDHHCCTIAGSYPWTYLRNDSTGVYGWVRDDLLSDDGSYGYCGF